MRYVRMLNRRRATGLAVCKSQNCTPGALASLGSYPERPKNAAQSQLPKDAAGDSRGQRPVAVTQPAEAGHSRGIKPSECHKAVSRGG